MKIGRKLNVLIVLIASLLFIGGCSSDDEKKIDDKTNQETLIAFDDSFTVEENSKAGESNQIDVSANDKKGADAQYSLGIDAKNGRATKISNGVFEYIPMAGFIGNDSFTYTLSNNKGEKSTATVNVKVVPRELTAEVFENIDPNFPSFVSVRNTTPEDKKWVKLESMSDEFDTWDNSKWFKSVWHYGVPVFMSRSAENSGVSDGNLWIRATLNEANPEGRWFQTARIHSRTKIKYPMYTEARIKTSSISAFNTYWLNNGNIDDRDEIDIIENNANPTSEKQKDVFPWLMNSQYFHADSDMNPGEIRNSDNFPNDKLSKNNPLKGVKWDDAYHTYGVWWKDSKNIQFYLNGEPAGSVVVGEDRSGTIYPNRKFTRDLEIIFDLWTVDEDWLGGLPEKSELENDAVNTMRIDWVRTWVLEDK